MEADVTGTFLDDRFLVLDELGHGEPTPIYLADDYVLDRLVALKLLRGGGDIDAEDRFLSAARTLEQVRHDNVVRIHSVGRTDSAAYIAMEYVSGCDLHALREAAAADGRQLPLRQAIDVARSVSSALAAVHDAGLVHGNVAPASIILEEKTSRPVLTDFELAPLRDRASVRADIDDLGRTIFELLTGRTVFEDSVAPPPSSIRPELQRLDAVLTRALAKDPDDRYESCRALLADLEAAAASQS
jgi:serine/threonine-protein kinase